MTLLQYMNYRFDTDCLTLAELIEVIGGNSMFAVALYEYSQYQETGKIDKHFKKIIKRIEEDKK